MSPLVFGRDRDPQTAADFIRGKRTTRALPLSQRGNPMAAALGVYPEPRACGDCEFLVVKHDHGSRRYHGCLKRGITNGPGTDHLVGWQACVLFEERGDG